MAKLVLIAEPTFKSKVGIPVAGGPPVDVIFTFKHRTKTELEAFVKSRAEQSDEATFAEMVVGWELEDPFTPESIALLLENYIGAALATYLKYLDELVQHKTKNSA